jgi:hypothetical protein
VREGGREGERERDAQTEPRGKRAKRRDVNQREREHTQEEEAYFIEDFSLYI